MLDLSHLEAAPAVEAVSWALETYGDSFAIATAFQKEGMVIVDLAARISPRVRVFTLDTRRLPGETLSFMDTVARRYGIAIETVLPDPAEVAEMVSAHGRDLFYDSLEGRQLCCEIRKVRPLQRKLRELEAWAAGLRREQAETRADVPKAQWVDGRVKLNPLADWTSAQVEQYIRENRVPVHPLYERGYASIGCAPCTRAVEPGEDGRAGRWWWEKDGKKECGIHFAADGSARRGLPVDGDA